MVSLISGVIGIGVAALIVLLVRKDHLHVNHGFGWMVAAAGFSLLGFAPGIIDGVADWLDIAYPPVLGLSIAIVVLVIKLLLLDIEYSRLEMRNQRQVQRVAMLEADLNSLAEDVRAKSQPTNMGDNPASGAGQA